MNKLEHPQQEIELEEKHHDRATTLETAEAEERFNLEQRKIDPEKLAEANRQVDEALDKIKRLPKTHENIADKKTEDKIPQLDASELKNIEETSKKWDRRITNVTDFVPVIGSAKMIIEGLRGKQYMTEKEITGLQRVVHTLSGVVFLGLDLTGVGAIASEFGKGAIKIGERIVFEKVVSKIQSEAVQKQAAKLALIGDNRVNRGKEIKTEKIKTEMV